MVVTWYIPIEYHILKYSTVLKGNNAAKKKVKFVTSMLFILDFRNPTALNLYKSKHFTLARRAKPRTVVY